LKVGLTKRSAVEEDPAVYSIRRLVSPVDEELDLDEAQISEARRRTIAYWREHGDKSRYKTEPTRAGGRFLRAVRPKTNGLLLIYLLDHTHPPNPAVGFATSFPDSGTAQPITYKVNSVYWDQEVGLDA
jgi:hypothetical protein